MVGTSELAGDNGRAGGDRTNKKTPMRQLNDRFVGVGEIFPGN